MENKSKLSPHILGFRRGKSGLDCLSRIVMYIQLGFANKKPTVSCFLDIENAYNNIMIEKVIGSLDKLGVGK